MPYFALISLATSPGSFTKAGRIKRHTPRLSSITPLIWSLNETSTCPSLPAGSMNLAISRALPAVWSAPMADEEYVTPMPFSDLGSYAGMACPFTAGILLTFKTFPVTDTPLPIILPRYVPLPIWSIRSRAPSESPNSSKSASMATPMHAPVSIVSTPT